MAEQGGRDRGGNETEEAQRGTAPRRRRRDGRAGADLGSRRQLKEHLGSSFDHLFFLSLGQERWYGRQNNGPPKDALILIPRIPRTCVNMFPYMAKGLCTDVINLRILRCGDYPGFPRWFQCDHKMLIRGWQEHQRRQQ